MREYKQRERGEINNFFLNKSYKDFFVLSKNGQRALDVEVNSIGDPSVKVQDLEDSRREIIALSGVPAPLTK